MSSASGNSVHLTIPQDITAAVTTTGLGDVNGALVWDLGAGPLSLWGACSVGAGEWDLVWAPSGACVKVALMIHAL